jgi:hypothetical protein
VGEESLFSFADKTRSGAVFHGYAESCSSGRPDDVCRET